MQRNGRSANIATKPSNGRNSAGLNRMEVQRGHMRRGHNTRGSQVGQVIVSGFIESFLSTLLSGGHHGAVPSPALECVSNHARSATTLPVAMATQESAAP